MSEELFEYGIHTEASDIRAHVSVVHRSLYVFQTRNGVQAIAHHKPQLRPAYQNGVSGPTAEGWLVKPEWIPDLRTLPFISWDGWDKFNESMPTNEKGALAVQCTLEAMKRGRFPFWVNASEDDRTNIQLKGTDILVFCRKRIQVKCDYRSGHTPKGTGNLFLQKSERNPRKLY